MLTQDNLKIKTECCLFDNNIIIQNNIIVYHRL